ncbi:DUF1336-containing protein [Aureococcus anophagefferens]|nr:DUF1336-containing protein [Aureococcus anophagefferens]
MAPPISGTALKRGRYQGTWRERFFYMAEGSSTLRYWESDADRLAGLRARGEFEVFGAAPLGDASERPWVVAVHVAAGGRVEAALRAAGVPSREEWLALPSAEARDAWVAALAAAAAPEKSARDESLALDDDVWADAAQTAAPAGVGGASVYDYSIVREGWRVRVTYHVLVTVDGPAAGAAAEPWSVRRTHGDFRALLARLDATQQHRDMADDFATLEDVARLDRRHGAMNPKRFLSSRHLRRRVALLNSLLARVVRDDALRTSEAFRDFIRPQPLRDVDDRAPPAPPRRRGRSSRPGGAARPRRRRAGPRRRRRRAPSSARRDHDPRLSFAAGVLIAAPPRAYGAPGALLAALFACGAACGGRLGARDAEERAAARRCALPPWPSPSTNDGHCWSEPAAGLFRVRGGSYLADRVKVPSAPSLCALEGVDLFLTDVPQLNVARHPGAFVAKRRAARVPDGCAAADAFCLNFCMPWGNFVIYWARPPPDGGAAARVLDDFVRARDDGHRDARLKLIPRVVEGNWLVRRAVGGGHNAAKLAEALKLSYFSGPDYFEVDADIVGSAAARRILSVVKSATSELVLDLALVVEGATPEDLPEHVLGAVRLHRVDPALALALDLCPLASG